MYMLKSPQLHIAISKKMVERKPILKKVVEI